MRRNYEGKHWMQDPKNRDRVMTAINKMHRARRKARENKPRSKAEKVIARAAKKLRTKKEQLGTTSIVLNGWILTLSHKTIKIEEG